MGSVRVPPTVRTSTPIKLLFARGHESSLFGTRLFRSFRHPPRLTSSFKWSRVPPRAAVIQRDFMSRLWIYRRTWPSIARRCRDEWLPGVRTRARVHVHTVQVSMFYSLPTSFSGRAPLRRCYAISNVNSRISRAPPIPTAGRKKKEGGRKTSALFLGHRRQHVLMSHCSCGKLTSPPPLYV